MEIIKLYAKGSIPKAREINSESKVIQRQGGAYLIKPFKEFKHNDGYCLDRVRAPPHGKA